ncbi:MAG: hypothetical protein NTY77_18580 [Elusimicrobia bacterium]|nr:hypothetical protein [Elusimicrobiota bacterium]
MLNKDSGVGLLLAALIRRAASNWKPALLVVGGVGLVSVVAWFFVFRELSSQSSRDASQRLAAIAALPPPAAIAGPSRPASSPAAETASQPVRTAAEADRARALPPAKAEAARAAGSGSAPARGAPGASSASARAASGAAREGLQVTPSPPLARSESLPPFATDARAFTGRPVSVPLAPFSRQNKASLEQLSEPRGLKDDPQVKMPGRVLAGRGAHSESAPAAGQPPASAAGVASGQPVLNAPAQSGVQTVQTGQTVQGGGVAAAGASGSGASAGSQDLPDLAGLPGGAAALAAAGGGGGGGAGFDESAIKAARADAEKCSKATAYYTPLVQQASHEMLALNSQAISCGPTIKCSFAANSVCAESAEDESWLWWKRYYAAMCACARVHCQLKAKCEEVNSLTCEQLHACPLTATKPCQASPCDY